jgi:hypothetical protein
MSWTAPLGFALFLAAAAVGLAQLWLGLFSPEAFVKLMITIGVLLAIDVAWSLLLRERRDTAKVRDKNRLQ